MISVTRILENPLKNKQTYKLPKLLFTPIASYRQYSCSKPTTNKIIFYDLDFIFLWIFKIIFQNSLRWFPLSLTHVMPLVSFLKTSENLWLYEVFKGCRKRPVVWNGLINLSSKSATGGVFLKNSQNSQKKTSARVSFLIKLQTWRLQLYYKRDSYTVVFLCILRNF